MNFKKVSLLLGVMVLVLVAFPHTPRAEIFVEVYLGGVQPARSGTKFYVPHDIDPTDYDVARLYSKGNYNPAVIGGLKIGTWFVKEGTLGFEYPSWMKYLGFYLDFCYHRLTLRNKHIYGFIEEEGQWDLNDYSSGYLSAEGNVATLAFMFAGRYGFFPNSEVPFGRLQPYLAVGPALQFSTMRPNLGFSHEEDYFPVIKSTTASSTDIALAVDAGIRWMALKNVSFDIFYKMRLSQPSYVFDYADPIEGAGASFTYRPQTLVLHSAHVGVAYHF
jgi:hypothetical protein